jgi:hypothetical protein
MKRIISKQLVNIIFIVLVVGAALSIYFLSHAQSERADTPASPTPVSTDASSDNAGSSAYSLSGVPESVWLTHLESSDNFSATADPDVERAYSVSYGSAPTVTVQLSYTVDEGCVSSVELAFALPETDDYDSASSIEQFLASSDEAALDAQSDAVHVLLLDMIPACDAKDAVSISTVSLWVEKATQIQDEDDDYNAEENGVAFMAYRTQRKTVPVLICVFFMDS